MTSHNHGLIGINGNVEFGQDGPRVKDDASGAAMGIRNSADDAYIPLRVGSPLSEDDAVSKKYLETRANAIVTGQIDGTSPPSPGTPGRLWICTTAGGSFTLKYLYYDTGSAWDEIAPQEGLTMRVTDALTGGTDEYLADHIYVWDEDGSVWKDMGPNPAESNTLKGYPVVLDYTDVGANLIVKVPSGARVLRWKVYVSQVFDGVTPQAEIGDATDPDRHAPANEINLKKVGLYYGELLYLYGAATNVNLTLTIGGTPSQGQLTAYLEFVKPVGI